VEKVLALVAEDRLTEAVFRKCISEFLPDFAVLRSEFKGGRGNVQRELAAYANLAETMPVIVGVDLDQDSCAPDLLRVWQRAYAPHTNLVIRVAVREIESWVLADRKRFANFVGAQSDDITKNPDGLDDPKRLVLNLARAHAKPDLKRDLIPKNFSQYPRIGPAYNLQMCKFVQEQWRPHVAIKRSDSLARAVKAFTAFV